MKFLSLILLILLMLSVTLYAESKDFRTASIPEILNTGNPVLFSSTNGFAVQANKIFVTYIEMQTNSNILKLSVSNDFGNTFETHNLSELRYAHELVEPSLTVSEDGICSVYFVKANETSHNPELSIIIYFNDMISGIGTISDNVIGDITIHEHYSNRFFLTKSQQYSQLCEYMYFTNKEMSTLTDEPNNISSIVKFWGKDELQGKVHSNSSIWIQNAGTPPVNTAAPNWPLFHDKVTSSGNIYIYQSSSYPGTLLPGSCPVSQVFLEGYEENVEPIEIIRNRPYTFEMPFGSEPSDDLDIVMLVINGNSVAIHKANIIETEAREFTVYSSFPDALHPDLPIGEPLHTNVITMKDTLWQYHSSPVIYENGLFIPADVWIKGTVSGNMTIYTTGNAYIIGDITYQNTTPGESPEDNETDIFALVSEKSIYLKYKHRDPYTGQIIANNSQGPDGNVYLYGAYAAIGEKGEGPWGFKEEGVFSYEYQHPHGSPTPFYGISPFTGQDTLFTFIDMHRFKYPPDPHTTDGPYWTRWPGYANSTSHTGYPVINDDAPYFYTVYDYPYYNPVYPESSADIVYLRGTLNLFGSVLQMRRGFIRRSGNDSADNPDTANYWDPDNYVFGPRHPATGYNKQYSYDSRLQNNPFPWFPSAFTGKKNYSYISIDSTTEEYEVQNLFNSDDEIERQLIKSASQTNKLALLFKETGENSSYKLLISEDLGQSFTTQVIPETNIIINDLIIKNNYIYLLYHPVNQNLQLTLAKYDYTNAVFEIHNIITPELLTPNHSYSLVKTRYKSLLITGFTLADDYHQRQIYELTNDYTLTYLDSFNIDFLEDLQVESLSFQAGIDDTLYVVIKTSSTVNESFSNIYFSKIYVNGVTPTGDETISANYVFKVSTYPNPFNPSTSIEFSLPEQDKINLSIFNVRGQRVKTLHNDILEKGLHNFVFDGKDEKGNSLSSGIYFMRISGSKYSHNKKILLLK